MRFLPTMRRISIVLLTVKDSKHPMYKDRKINRAQRHFVAGVMRRQSRRCLPRSRWKEKRNKNNASSMATNQTCPSMNTGHSRIGCRFWIDRCTSGNGGVVRHREVHRRRVVTRKRRSSREGWRTSTCKKMQHLQSAAVNFRFSREKTVTTCIY